MTDVVAVRLLRKCLTAAGSEHSAEPPNIVAVLVSRAGFDFVVVDLVSWREGRAAAPPPPSPPPPHHRLQAGKLGRWLAALGLSSLAFLRTPAFKTLSGKGIY